MFFFSNHLTLTKEIVILFIFFKNFRIKFPCLLEWTQLDVVLLGFTGFYWVLPGFIGYHRVLLLFRVLTSFRASTGLLTRFLIGFFLGFTGFYWVFFTEFFETRSRIPLERESLFMRPRSRRDELSTSLELNGTDKVPRPRDDTNEKIIKNTKKRKEITNMKRDEQEKKPKGRNEPIATVKTSQRFQGEKSHGE